MLRSLCWLLLCLSQLMKASVALALTAKALVEQYLNYLRLD
jgi:hypothetical protein